MRQTRAMQYRPQRFDDFTRRDQGKLVLSVLRRSRNVNSLGLNLRVRIGNRYEGPNILWYGKFKSGAGETKTRRVISGLTTGPVKTV